MEPKIRIKGFSGEWAHKSLGELCDVLTGYPFEGTKILPKGKDLLMRGINITEGSIRHNEEIDRYYNEDTSSLSKYRLNENDLVIGMDGSKVGKNSALVTKKEVNSLLVQRVARLRNKNPYVIRLIQIALGSKKFYEYVDSMKTSSAIPHISPSVIKNFIISLSNDSNEIKSVASYFQNLDTLIQSTTKKIESLKQVKAASLQSMFPQEGETKPRIRFKEFEGDWVPTLIGDCGTWSKGRLLSKEDITPKGKTKCIHYGELFTLYGEVINKVQSKTDLQEGCISQIGDILFPDSDVTPTGLARCSALMEEGVILGGGINILKPQKHIHSPFLSYAINMEKEQIISRVTGTTVRHINSRALSEVVVILPQDIKEQQAIANYFTNLDTQITLQTQRLEKLKQIKSACLDNMFV